ncbi:MAG: glycosyltransferase [Candidatus Aenigmarchaeota archaeon]|nr:glycosyltransferase [Candidatus Aenigmarchaeota archaeon]
MAVKYPGVSFIIPTHNEEKTIKFCLGSISKQDYDGKVEIILIDDKSADSTCTIIKSVKHIGTLRLIKNKTNKGFAASVNRGISASRYDFVCLLEADCVLGNSGWLRNMVQSLTNDPKLATVRSSYTIPKVAWKNYNFWMKLFFIRLSKGYKVNKPVKTANGIGRATLIRKSVFRKLGLLDEKTYRTGGEDFDFSVRARMAGYSFITVPSIVYHYHGLKGNFTFRDYIYKRMQYAEIKGVLRRKFGDRMPLKRCSEIVYMLLLLGLLIPQTFLLSILLLILNSFYFTYLMLFQERSYRLLYAPFARLIGDVASALWFLKGFLTNRQRI